jgi:YbbR domain-containing protein
MRLRDSILNNFWLKVFSLLMATMIWFAVQSNLPADTRQLQNPFHGAEMRDFVRPVAVTTSATNQIVFRINPSEVRVTLRAERGASKHLKASDIQAYVDLTEAKELHGTFPIKINAPRQGISEVVVWPQYAHVEPEKKE